MILKHQNPNTTFSLVSLLLILEYVFLAIHTYFYFYLSKRLKYLFFFVFSSCGTFTCKVKPLNASSTFLSETAWHISACKPKQMLVDFHIFWKNSFRSAKMVYLKLQSEKKMKRLWLVECCCHETKFKSVFQQTSGAVMHLESQQNCSLLMVSQHQLLCLNIQFIQL